jgi:aspartate-semialdehyde dehydrogenase
MFSHPIAFNCIPCIDKLQDNGYTKEEMKVAWETRKIFCAPDMKVSVTAVRIPTLRAHSEAISIQTKDVIDVAGVKEVLATAKGLVVKDDTANDVYERERSEASARTRDCCGKTCFVYSSCFILILL